MGLVLVFIESYFVKFIFLRDTIIYLIPVTFSNYVNFS